MKQNKKIKSWDKVREDIKYLFSKINWGQSFLDAKAVTIMNEFVSDIDKLLNNKKIYAKKTK